MSLRIKSLGELGKGAWSLSKGHQASEKKVTENTKADAKAPSKKKVSAPQAALFNLIEMAWPGLSTWELSGVIPGRRFSVDIAFQEQKICCEVDGWQYHGKHKQGFHRDREKDKLLILNGWRTLRFTAKEINSDGIGCLRAIEKLLGIKSKISLE